MLSRGEFIGGTAATGAVLALAGCDGGSTTDADQAGDSSERKVLKFGIGSISPIGMQVNGMTATGSVADAIFEPLQRWTARRPSRRASPLRTTHFTFTLTEVAGSAGLKVALLGR